MGYIFNFIKILIFYQLQFFMLSLISFWLWATFHEFYNLFIKTEPIPLSHYIPQQTYNILLNLEVEKEIKARTIFNILNFSLKCNLLNFAPSHILTNMHDEIFETFLFTDFYKSVIQVRIQINVQSYSTQLCKESLDSFF